MSNDDVDRKEQEARESVPSLTEYAERVIAERLDKMVSLAEDVRKNEATEPVHQMRVWSRRTRAALEIFEACYPGKAFHALEREVKRVTGALGEARDLDVMIEKLVDRAEALTVPQRSGLESFVENLRQQRDKGQHNVADAVTHLEQSDLKHSFTSIAAKQNAPRHGSKRAHGTNAHG